MAISLRTAGSWAYASSGSVTPTLPTHAAGDMLLVRVAYKSTAIATCTASCATSGWAKVGEFYDGAGNNSGNGTGSVNVAVFWKVATSDAEGNPTVSFSQTVTQVGHVALSYQKGTTEGFITPVGDGGYDSTADMSKSMTIASHVSVTAGDMVDFFYAVRDDSVCTSPTITQTGVTFGVVSEQPATAGIDTSGADGAYDGGYRLASSGTSSAAAVVTGTIDSNETGSAWMTRLRVQTATTVYPGVAAATAAGYADTGNVAAGGTGRAQPSPAAYAAIPSLGMSGTGVAPATAAGYGTDATVSPTGGVGPVTAAGAGVTTAVSGTTGSAASTAEGYGNGPGVGATASVAEILAAALAATAQTGAGGITFDADVAAAVAAALAGHGTLSTNAGLARVRTA